MTKASESKKTAKTSESNKAKEARRPTGRVIWFSFWTGAEAWGWREKAGYTYTSNAK